MSYAHKALLTLTATTHSSIISFCIIILYHHPVSSSRINMPYQHPVSTSLIIIAYHHPISSSYIIILYLMTQALDAKALEAKNIIFNGSLVVDGSCYAVVIRTGDQVCFSQFERSYQAYIMSVSCPYHVRIKHTSRYPPNPIPRFTISE